MSIRSKFVLVLTVILVVGVGTTGTALILQQARHDRTLLAEKQLLLVEHAAFALQGNLTVAARELSRIAKLPEFDPADNDTDPERQLLYGAHENSLYFKVVRILDAEGRVTLVQPAGGDVVGTSYGDRHWFESARKTRQPFFYTAPERAAVPESIAVIVPVWRDGRFASAIQGIADLHDDKVLLAELRHTAGSGEFAVVDREGRIIFPPGETSLAEHGWRPAFDELSRQRAGSRHIDDAHGDFMYAWAPVGVGTWGVVMRWPWSTLNASFGAQVRTTVTILVVGVLLVGLVAVVFAAYLSRPLLTLGAVAARLARGEPGGAPRSNRRDEVGGLLNGFHTMETELAARDARIREDLETISRLNASLEERVRERTRELEEAQARLLDVERFAAMGKTAAAIAHELKNALNGLGMCVDLVLADAAAAEGASGHAANSSSMKVRAQIHYEIARLRDVTQSLLTFSRTPRIERAPSDVNALAAHALDVLGQQIADGGVTVHRELDGAGEPLWASIDGYKVQGVIINLVKNGVEAMTTRPLDLNASALAPDAGPGATPQERTLMLRSRRGDDGAVILEVEDTGPGLLPEARAHLFEPFFTTKVTGTGLGLPTARRIVEAHGGAIEVTDREDGREGTRVRVTLPRAQIAEAQAAV